MKRGELLLVWTLLSAANFMAVLDMTIVNVSLPHIAGSMAAAPNEGTLVVTFFAVSQAIMLPLTGWLSTRFGTVRVFLTSIIAFAATSLLCGLAQNLPMLIAFRILQGLAAGPLMPLSQAILVQTTPPKKMAAALSFWSTTVIIGPVAGPLLGGFFSDTIGWEWSFFINIPIGAVVFIVAARVLPKYEQPTAKLPVDYIGLSLMILWIGALQFVLDFGKDHDWFSSPLILLVTGGAIVSFLAFVFWEITEKHPIVDLNLFRNRDFTITLIAAGMAMGTQFASIVIIPLWIQTALGFTATTSGILVATTGILAFCFTPLVGRLIPKVDPRLLVFGGMTGLAIVMMWRSSFVSVVPFSALVLPQMVQGAMMPFFFVSLQALAMASIPPTQIPAASGMLAFSRTICSAIATSLVTTSWESQTSVSSADLRARVQNEEIMLSQLQQQGFSPEQAMTQLDRMVEVQSLTLATNHTFVVMAIILFTLAVMIWLVPGRKVAPPSPDAAAAH